MRWLRFVSMAMAGLAVAASALAQDPSAWLESQGLEATDTKPFEDFVAVVVHAKGAADAAAAQERVVVFRQGKPVLETSAKDAPAGSRWTIRSIGRDLDGDGQPDLHLSSFTGSGNCCTTHFVYRLKPRVARTAVYASGAMGGGDFLDVPGRKGAVMISADDSSANAFAPYANSYFPMVVLEVGHGRLELARDLMQSRLPGMPPPVCQLPVATANLWLKERCGEYTGLRRQERTAEVKQKLAAIKSGRSVEKLEWSDYFGNGLLGAVAAEMNPTPKARSRRPTCKAMPACAPA